MEFSNSQGQGWLLQVCSEKFSAQCPHLWLGLLGFWVSYAGQEMGGRQPSDRILFGELQGSSWPYLACDFSRGYRFHVSFPSTFAYFLLPPLGFMPAAVILSSVAHVFFVHWHKENVAGTEKGIEEIFLQRKMVFLS
jgi:hypothetical protein